ncbi:hypothetical protein [Halomonas sp. PR-M31]|uniref:hypothetical protein n=1 Tax=Halomonas sp. PR-M31 TaxID=1471202 RepID=UPI0006509221|nr:hypothetical protein [Halomonas sp. PR-M31]
MSLKSDLEDFAQQNPDLQSAIDQASASVDQFTAAFDKVVAQVRTSAENYWEQVKNDYDNDVSDGDDVVNGDTDVDTDDTDTDDNVVNGDTDVDNGNTDVSDDDVKIVADGETATYDNTVTDADNFSGGAVENGLKAVFSGDTANVELNDVGQDDGGDPDFSDYDSSFALTLDEADDANVGTLNVDGTAINGANLLFDVANGDDEGLQSLDTINLGISSNADFSDFENYPSANVLLDGESLGGVSTIDASDSPVDLTLAAPSLEDTNSALSSVIQGDGDDTTTLYTDQLTSDTLDVELGQGDDTITLNQGEADSDGASPTAVSLTGGGGDNTFAFKEGNITNDENSDTGFTNTVAITDFDGGDDDILQFEQFDGFADQSTVDDALNSDASLYDNVMAVANAIDEGATAQFGFDGNTYVYQDTDTDDDDPNFDDGDTLIELTGVDQPIDTGSVVGA